MDEKKLLDQIRQSASDLTPPESLNPDAIEKLLSQKTPAKSEKKKIFVLRRLAGAAAVFVLCAVSFWQIQKIHRDSADLEKQMTEKTVSVEAESGKFSQANDESSSKKDSSDDAESGETSRSNDESSSEKTSSDDAKSGETARSDDESSLKKASPAETEPLENVPAPTVGNEFPETAASADDSENVSLLPHAQSYEEIYDALREKFYYEDDVIYDMEADMGVLTSSVSSAAATADGTAGIEADYGASDDTAEIAADYGASDDTAEIAADYGASADTAGIAADYSALGGTAEDGAVINGEEANVTTDEAAADMIIRGDGAAADVMEVPEAAEEEMAAEDSAAVSDPSSSVRQTAEPASGETTDKDADYSTTNIQEFGVDEADIVKTDGQYIYILRQNGSVTIVDARDPQNLKEASTIPPAGSDLLGTNEMYADKDTLNVIATRQTTSLEQDGDVYYPSSTRQTVLYTYDISDRTVPKLTGTVSQDGDYETSRKNGTFIYLFTSWYPNLGATYAESRIIPAVNGSELNAADFYLPESLTSSSYLLISSVNTEDPQDILDKKALVSGTSNFYVSPENIYIANENWNQNTTMTDIMKFHYEGGKITGTAAGSVKGYLNNSFSLNEYNGFLRVVSTYYDDNYEEQNGLYILDESLHITGSIENLAEGETIRSARFFGDIGYFVTFRQTDPLFSADLSDPASPVILGDLKVSGFSSYLHFYGQDLLLGMGYEADEQTGVTSGVKLSMFDVSDPTNVTELHRLVIPGVTWCPSVENYKSILIDPQKNIFGFFCGDRYLVFSYDKEKGFVSELVYDFIEDALSGQMQTPEDDSTNSNSENETPDDGDSADSHILETGEALDGIFTPLDGDTGNTAAKSAEDSSAQSIPEFEITTSDSAYYPSISADNTRGLYIGDTFYLAGDVSVIAFDMTDDYSRLGKLPL